MYSVYVSSKTSSKRDSKCQKIFHSQKPTIFLTPAATDLSLSFLQFLSLLPLERHILDLSAALDTIDHNILLSRLEHVFGMHGTALQWFFPYLSTRIQTVSIKNVKSDPAPVPYVVPRGSVLGSVLFVLYTTPLFDVI